MFRGLRRHRAQAARFLVLGPEELRRRWFWLCKNLGLEGPPAAAYLASAPSLLLADPAEASAVVRWLSSAAGWRRLGLRRNLQRSPALLLTPVAQLEGAAAFLQHQLDASVDELCLLLSAAPRLLALPPVQLAEAVAAHPTSWQLAAHWMERPPMLMRDAAVRRSCARPGPLWSGAGAARRAALWAELPPRPPQPARLACAAAPMLARVPASPMRRPCCLAEPPFCQQTPAAPLPCPPAAPAGGAAHAGVHVGPHAPLWLEPAPGG